MSLTSDQQKAYNLCLRGQNVFIGGIAGGGKSFLISEIKKGVEEQGHKCVVTSTTNFSARQISGITIHHFLKFNPKMNMKDIDYRKKAINLCDIDVLIIDEISMLGAKVFDYVSQCIKVTENKIQLIVFGDFYQLHPVNDKFAFQSKTWAEFQFAFVELKECIRQDDQAFVKALEDVRVGGQSGLAWIKSHCSKQKIEDAISICPKNDEVDRINQKAYDRSNGKPFENIAKADGEWNKDNYEFVSDLKLKFGQKIRFVANAEDGRYHRGDFGTFVDYNKDEFIMVKMEKTGEKVLVKQTEFQCDKDGEMISVKQFPVVPGYAITIHKAQGQTFSAANVYLTNTWELGMIYVALSRVKRVENLWIDGLPKARYFLNRNVVKLYNSFNVMEKGNRQ